MDGFIVIATNPGLHFDGWCWFSATTKVYTVPKTRYWMRRQRWRKCNRERLIFHFHEAQP